MTNTEIRALRISLGWSQSRLAKECGVITRAVKMWEQGVRRPGGSALILLSRLGRVTTDRSL